MAAPRESLRARRSLRGELALALLPTLTILIVFSLVDVLSRQRVLFSSLASSAFLIYLDPQHRTNRVRTLMAAHATAALAGFLAYLALGAGVIAGGAAMLATIGLMIVLDIAHPPAVSTSLIFAFRSGNERDLILFGLALAVIAILVVLEQASLWALRRGA